MARELIQIPSTQYPVLSVIAAIFLILIPIMLGVFFYRKGRRYAFLGGLIGLILAVLYIPLSFGNVFTVFNSIFYYQCGLFTQCFMQNCNSCSYFFAPVIIYFEFMLAGFFIGWIIDIFKRSEIKVKKGKKK